MSSCCLFLWYLVSAIPAFMHTKTAHQNRVCLSVSSRHLENQSARRKPVLPLESKKGWADEWGSAFDFSSSFPRSAILGHTKKREENDDDAAWRARIVIWTVAREPLFHSLYL